jgi:hypothetical protein
MPGRKSSMRNDFLIKCVVYYELAVNKMQPVNDAPSGASFSAFQKKKKRGCMFSKIHLHLHTSNIAEWSSW